jgi:hypothetical protein
MKKGLKVFLVCLLTMTIVACGGGNAQEEIVDEFFAQLAEGKSSKMEKLMTKGVDDNIALLDFVEELNGALDWDYGPKWNKQRGDFIESAFKSVIASYEIDDVTEKGDNVVIKVKGKRLKYEEFYSNLDTESAKGLEDFNDELDEVFDSLMNDEYDFDEFVEADSEVYNKYAEEYFDVVTKTFEDLKTTSFTITFTLQEEDDEWLIDEIDGTKEWPVFSEEEYDEELGFEDDENDFGAYTVDQELCRPENTILGKGNLLNSYSNEKDVETSLNFVDFNAKNAAGEEMVYGDLTYTEPITIEVEVVGNIGDTFYLEVEETDLNKLISEKITLTEEHMVITREINGIKPETTELYLQLFVEYGYNESYGGDEFGYYFIWRS